MTSSCFGVHARGVIERGDTRRAVRSISLGAGGLFALISNAGCASALLQEQAVKDGDH